MEEVKRVEENTILEEAQGPFLPLRVRQTDRKKNKRGRDWK